MYTRTKKRAGLPEPPVQLWGIAIRARPDSPPCGPAAEPLQDGASKSPSGTRKTTRRLSEGGSSGSGSGSGGGVSRSLTALERLHAAYPEAVVAISLFFESTKTGRKVWELETLVAEESRAFVEQTAAFYVAQEEEQLLVATHGLAKYLAALELREAQHQLASRHVEQELRLIEQIEANKKRKANNDSFTGESRETRRTKRARTA